MQRPLWPAAPAARTVLVLAALLVGACAHRPLPPQALAHPELSAIERAFAQTLERAYADPERRWHSGWAGNIWVNLAGDRDLGLCYDWQRLVYRGVLPTVRRVRWHANGIVINKGTAREHHAVVVFDPRNADQDRLLSDPGDNPAWVLDAWRRGRPDIYPLEEWVALSWFRLVPPRIIGVITDED